MTIKQQLISFLENELPQAELVIEDVGDGTATVRKPISDVHLRPGKTVLGPTIMELVDAVLFAAIAGRYGLQKMAFTTNININFLNRPDGDRDLIAHCTLIKAGKSLAVGNVSVFSDGRQDEVAHATGTFSLPRRSESS